MNYHIPPEPKKLKKHFMNQKKNLEIKIDTFTLWFGNKLPSYLWRDAGWSKPLKDDGYSWQSFLKIFSLHKREMIKWSNNSLSWNDFLCELQQTLKDPLFKKMLVKKT
jgi:hypothetical protein